MSSTVLHIRLLGELDLRLGGAPLPPLESARARSLLAFLLLNRNAPQPRQRLAFLLWPDSSEAQARTNLRHLLHSLKRAVPQLAGYLEVGSGTLQWHADARLWVDVAAFEAALAKGEEDGADELAALREAVGLYRGDLLPGCYDEWLSPERDRLRRRHLHALERIAEIRDGRGDHAAAARCVEELLSHDPLNEAAYRRLMRLHFARGDRGSALRAFRSCEETLERELGVEPSAATQELYEALRSPGIDAEGGRDRGRAGAPPLVGRAAEWERVTALWRASERGRAQLVLVTGEPGIGKTRLIEELRSWCADRGVATAEARSYRAEGALAYGPVAAWLRSDALRPNLAGLGHAHLTELARLLPELLTQIPDLPRPEPLPENDQRARLFSAVARAILVSGRPLLLLADDLHWGDLETLRLLHHLLRAEPDAPLLLAATARREEMDDRHPLNDLLLGLQMLDRATEIALERLGAAAAAALGERLSGRPLERSDAERLYAETEGNPLFVVEALRAGWSGGRGGRAWSSQKIQAVIRHRLSQLSAPALELAGVAATIGREFTAEVLAEASGADRPAFVGGLDELWRSGIVREHGPRLFDFSHDRIREVAYLSMGPARRRQSHRAVAQALERLHAHDRGPVSAQIAGHYERAGVIEEAITWYEAAAEAAEALNASADAVRVLERALTLLLERPDFAEHRARELSILTAMLTPVANVEGFGSPRLDEVQRRSLDLARRLGVDPPPQLVRTLAIASLARDDFDGAQRYGEQLRARGHADGDDALLVESDYVLGIASFWQGALLPARRHFESAVAGYRPDRRRAHLLRYWLDPHVVCLSRLGNTFWFLGDPAAAVAARDDALALAARIGHPNSHTTALVFAALLAVEMEATERLREYVTALESWHGEHVARPTQVATRVLRAYLRVLDGETEEGLAGIRKALDDPGGVEHAPGLRAVLSRLLLAACAAAGDVRGRLETAERMLRMGGAARLWEAEARLARAECLAALHAPVDAVCSELERALDVARRQGARGLEAKASASLHRFHPPDRGSSPAIAAP